MQLVYSIICDDIRFEQNNKMSFVGIYGEGILVPTLPFIFPKLCIPQEFSDVAGIQTLKFVLRGPKLNLPAISAQVRQTPNRPNANRIKAPICFGPVTFEQEGDYSFETYLDDQKEAAFIRKFYVRLRPKPDKETSD